MRLTTLLMGAGLCSGLSAQPAETQWGVGVGAIVQNEGYVQAQTETHVIPFVTYRSEHFYVVGPKLGYHLYRDKQRPDITVIGQFRFDGFEIEDSAYFSGMEERDVAFDMGLEVKYRTSLGQLSGYYLKDVTGAHEGSEAGISYAYPIPFSRQLRLTPSVTLSRLDGNLVDYYYGVRQQESTIQRPFYQGNQTTNVSVALNMLWQLTSKHSLIGNVQYSHFGDEIKNSPLIEDNGSLGVVAGYIYAF
ncbi:MipA/OmpV family protein [Lacimicrobium sp. SS2-24]|uniref:MipA/OmpV family protein n=1 Tax=Lacimicrobium sp. SS2-24 TaxID=2005569 RepID=UPI000B4AFEA8|nr:MipA/OmpV family protein [Lacimicrobium sp. SS2-24]